MVLVLSILDNHSDLCLAGEDKSFIKNFMTKEWANNF